ncbi:MAG: hypothetical protein VW405_11640 [Rhodospirillaceae bacterium]
MVAGKIIAGFLATLFTATAPSAAAEREETIPTREGVTISFVVTEPAPEPRAAAILFMGGNGKMRLWRGRGARNRNFLVRSRQLFADRGIFTVTVDVASDQRTDGLIDIRDGADHRKDIAAVADWIRDRTRVPLWLVGTSRGTVSVAHLAGVLPVDGAVFSATVTEPSSRRAANVHDANLDRIRVPTLVVHHRHDECHVTPAYGVSRLVSGLGNAPKVESMMFEGGKAPISGPCEARSAHGFFGIEEKVVDATVRWMLANGGRRSGK